jgi:hypothetical protein
VFPPVLVESSAARDPDLGAAVAARSWTGGAHACENVALAAADLTVAAGDDRTIASLAARARGRFIGHGHRISFAVVGNEIATDAAARAAAAAALALDVAIWDQRGCLSPQLCFVEGDGATAEEFGAAVATALRPLAERLPPARLTDADRLAVRRFEDEAEWRGLAGEAVQVFRVGATGAGTVVVEPTTGLRPTPLQRSLRVMPIARVGDLGALLAPFRGALEGAGLALGPERWDQSWRLLEAAGVHRVCALGEMQRPPLTWRQGGRPRLAEWMQ